MCVFFLSFLFFGSTTNNSRWNSHENQKPTTIIIETIHNSRAHTHTHKLKLKNIYILVAAPAAITNFLTFIRSFVRFFLFFCLVFYYMVWFSFSLVCLCALFWLIEKKKRLYWWCALLIRTQRSFRISLEWWSCHLPDFQMIWLHCKMRDWLSVEFDLLFLWYVLLVWANEYAFECVCVYVLAGDLCHSVCWFWFFVNFIVSLDLIPSDV